MNNLISECNAPLKATSFSVTGTRSMTDKARHAFSDVGDGEEAEEGGAAWRDSP